MPTPVFTILASLEVQKSRSSRGTVLLRGCNIVKLSETITCYTRTAPELKSKSIALYRQPSPSFMMALSLEQINDHKELVQDEHPSKRVKLDGFAEKDQPTVQESRKGIAPVKSE